MIRLKPYQKETVETINDTFLSESRQFCEMPTGSGKTFTFLYFAKQNNKKTLIVVTTKELLRQVYESSLLFFNKTEISRKGDQYNEKISTLHICIVNSLRNDYLNKIIGEDFKLVIIDEAHHSHSSLYTNLLSSLSEKTKILGVTATPERTDGKLLENLFHKKSVSLSLDYMITSGYLCDFEGFSLKTKIDLEDVDRHNGDFSLNILYKKLSTKSRNDLIVSVVKNDLKNRKCMVFCINVKHSMEINNLLNEAGISSAHIDGKMNTNERKQILSAFQEGLITCLTNCQLLTEGFDEPSIDGIVLARPTVSPSLFKQMVGRGLRLYPGKKNCKIVDIVDAHRSISGFNSLYCHNEERFPEKNNFSSFSELKDYIQNKRVELVEFKIEKSSLFLRNGYEEQPITFSMSEYLENEKIFHDCNISFDEASFLIWKNELNKRYKNDSRNTR